MVKGITVRQFRIIGQSNTDVTLSAKEAENTRDVLAKFIYAALFDWLVQKINKSMVVSSVASNDPVSAGRAAFSVKGLGPPPLPSSTVTPVNNFNPNKCIGILDIFGFEIFEHNSFEQLCINYCNEKLQHHFSDHTFKLEEIVYQQEGIQFDKIKYIDNQPVLDCIELKPSGILRILDEELIVPKGSDEGFLKKSAASNSKNSSFKASPIPTSFVIVHYAGHVTYDAIGFLEKNRDTLSEDLLELLATSKMPFIFEIFPNLGAKLSAKERKASLGFQFSKQLDNLMNTLNATEPHYIRCIKPNNEKKKDYFIASNVMEQLRYSGVFEAVQIRRSGFPFRQTHNNFVERYKLCNMDKQYEVSKRGCEQIVADMKLNRVNVQMGRTMVLYRSEEYKLLELHRSINLEKSTLTEKLKNLIARNPSTEKDPESYFMELSRTVKRAKELRFTNDTFEKAREMLFSYIENRIDPPVKQALEQARQHRDLAALDAALAICDEKEFDTSLVRKARAMKDRLNRIVEEALNAAPALLEHHMNVVIKAADELQFQNDYVEYFRALIFQTPLDLFLKEQMKAAVKLGDHARAIRITLKLKEVVLSSQEDSFQFQKYGKLKAPKDWADEKLFTFDREKLAQSMLVYVEDSTIHGSLVDFLNIGLTQEQAEKLDRHAQSIFKRIQLFCVDNSPVDGGRYKYAKEILSFCISDHHLRDEAYLLVFKQLSRNPNGQLISLLWELLSIFLNYFPPNADFENYVQVFLRQKANPRDKYLGALNKLVYEGIKITLNNLPSYEELRMCAVNLTHRARGFSEPLPPAAPPYIDLMTPYEDVDPEAEFFAKKAPRPASSSISVASLQPKIALAESIQSLAQVKLKSVDQTVGQTVTQAGGFSGLKNMQSKQPSKPSGPPPVKKPCAWQSAIDPSSGDTYYYNETTGESSWEAPPEWQFQHLTRNGSRI